MTTYAEGLVNRRNRQSGKQTAEDFYNELRDRRNKLFSRINKAENYKDIVSVIRDLKTLEQDGYTDQIDLLMLKDNISDAMQDIKQKSETKLSELKTKQKEIKAERFPEDIDMILRLNTEADNILLQLILQLSMSADAVKNKILIVDMLNKQDRATNIALSKLSQMPEYKDLISPSMKKELLLGIKSKTELKWEEKQNNRLSEVSKEMAEVTMNGFMLDKAERLMF